MTLLLALLGFLALGRYGFNTIALETRGLQREEFAPGTESCAAFSLRWHAAYGILPLPIETAQFATANAELSCQHLGRATTRKLKAATTQGSRLHQNLLVVSNRSKRFSVDDSVTLLDDVLQQFGYIRLSGRQQFTAVYGPFTARTELSVDEPIDYYSHFPFWLATAPAAQSPLSTPAAQFPYRLAAEPPPPRPEPWLPRRVFFN